MIFSRTGVYMGVSFSVPITLAMENADELRSADLRDGVLAYPAIDQGH